MTKELILDYGKTDVHSDERSESVLSEMSARYQALYQENSRLVHELDRLRERTGIVAQETRQEPRYVILCLSPECGASIARNALPPNDARPAWLRGLGWSEDGYCPECKQP